MSVSTFVKPGSSFKDYVQYFITAASLGFGAGGYVASHTLATQQSIQAVQIEQSIKIEDRLVGIQEHQSQDITTILQWIKDHAEVTSIEHKNADALKAARRGQ